MRYSKLCRSAQASMFVLALLAPAAAFAQAQDAVTTQQAGASAVPEQSGEQKAEGDESAQIVVTGSRIKRSQTEGPAPVTIITTEQMKKNGFATVYDALLTTTEAIGNVQNDYDWGQSSVNAYPLNLRNLGPGRTLLLVNGHRVADYPMPYQGKSNFANFNNLPTGIVQRTEILTGAASAIYGSDAMGGVVNVITNDKVEGHTARLKYGGATRGGRRNWEANLAGGFHGDSWSIVYNLQHFDRGTLLAKDRPFMDEESDRSWLAQGADARHFGIGYVNPYPGLYLIDADNGNRRIDPPSGACDQYGDLYFLSERLAYNRNTGAETHNGSYCAQRVFSNWALRTGSKDTSGYLHGTLDLGGVELWASAGIWKTVGGFNTFLDGFTPGNFWDPRANNGAGGTRNFLKFHSPEELGGQDATMTKSKELAMDFSAGLKGKVFGDAFDWELMVGHSTYNIDETFPTLNQGKMWSFYMGQKLGEHNGLGIYTPDYNKLWNPVSPSDTAAFSDRGLKQADSWMDQAQLVVSGKLFDGWAGPIQIAAVAEAGRQGYSLTPDPKTLLPCNDATTEECWYTPFGNIEQGGGKRNRYAGGVELNVPLLKSVNFDGAVRYDKYDAVASDAAFTYQLGLEFRPTRNLLARASYGTSFRAPDMHFVYAKASSSVSDFTDYSACFAAGFPNNVCPGGNGEPFHIDNASVQRAGTPGLLYEKGKSLTAGVVWDAFRGFSVSVDYWDIKIKNLIDDIGADQVLRDEAWCKYHMTTDGKPLPVPLSDELCALETGRVHRNAAGVVESIDVGPINRADTHVAGIDAKISYQFPSGPYGDFGISASYTQMLTYESRQFPTDPLQNSIFTQNPRVRANVTANWSKGPLNVSLYGYLKSGGRNNRWGGCLPFEDGYTPSAGVNCLDTDTASPTYGQSTAIIREHRNPRIYLNGSMGYDFSKWLRLNLYVSNIFDKIYGDPWCGDFAYCVDDPVGREVSGEIVVKF